MDDFARDELAVGQVERVQRRALTGHLAQRQIRHPNAPGQVQHLRTHQVMLVVDDDDGWLMVADGWLTHVEFLAVVGDLEHSDVGDEGAARQVERPHLTAAARKGLHRLVAHHGAVGQVQRPQSPAAALTRRTKE